MADIFHLGETARLSAQILASVAGDPADIQIKIAALRSVADLMQNAVTMAAVAASFQAALTPKR